LHSAFPITGDRRIMKCFPTHFLVLMKIFQNRFVVRELINFQRHHQAPPQQN